MKIKLLGILFIGLMLSCKVSKQKTENSVEPLKSGTFKVISINGHSVDRDKLTLKIDTENHHISGYTGCNNYSANITAEEHTLNVGMAKVTKRYCEDGMKLENSYLRGLRDTKSYTYDGRKLVLKSAEGDALITAQKTTEEE